MASLRIARTKRLFEGRRALAVIVLAGIVFLALGVLVRYSFLQAFDLHVTKELQEGNWPPLEAIMMGFTFAGSPAVLPVLGAISAVILWRLTLPRAAYLVLASLLAIPTAILMKTWWDRARPDAEIVNVAVKTAGASFPSGHALGATAFYGALAVLAWVHLDPRRTRLPLTISLIAMPILVDISRVYLGAHWLSDVVAGSALGLLLLIPLVRWYLTAIPAEAAEQAVVQGEL